MVKGSVVANSPLLPEKELGQAPFVAPHGTQCSNGARFPADLARNSAAEQEHR